MSAEQAALKASRSYLKYLATVTLLAVLYFLAGRSGLLLAIPPGYATAIFPPAGFALAALLLYGNRVWPGVLLGSFALNLSMSPQLDSVFSTAGLVALAIGIGATLQGLAGLALVRRFVGFPSALDDERDIFKFFMLGGPVSCLVNSIVGTTTLFLAGAITAEAYAFNWWTWWVGDVIGVFIAVPLVFVVVGEPRAIWKQRISSVAFPLLVTLAVVIVLFVRASAWESNQQQSDFSEETYSVSNTLQNNLQVYEAIVASIERHFVASGEVSRSQFNTFVSEAIKRHTGLQALLWLPIVKNAGRTHFEHAIQQEGFGNFHIQDRDQKGVLIPAKTVSEYVPVTYIEPYAGNEAALGYNLASNPVRLQALLKARDTGLAVATGRIKLVQETGEQYGFLLVLPVYDSLASLENTADRIQHIRGYTTAVLRVSDMLGNLAESLDKRDISLRVIDEAAPEDQQVLFQSPSWPNELVNPALAQTTKLNIGGRSWRIEFVPLPHYFITHRAWQAWATLAGGLLFTGMLGALLLLITGYTGKAQKLVDERTDELRIILDNVVDGILTIDVHGIVQSFNPAAEKIFSQPGNQVVGRNVTMLIPENYHSNYFNLLEYTQPDFQAKTSGVRRELVGLRHDGSTFVMDFAVSRSENAENPLYIVVVRDITERKRIERMKSEFVSTVSHELRTPLTSINGALGLLAGGKLNDKPEQANQMIEMAYKNSLRLAALIDDLLDMDKLVAGKMSLELKVQPLMLLVEQTLDSIRAYGAQYNVSFKLVAREEVMVNVEGSRLIQVLNNLMSNAAKFSPTGGQVEVAVQRVNSNVRIEVVDHGQGIPAEFKDQIFQKFSQADSSDTRKKGGTGLGLAISKELIERMHGTIGFDSVEGQGARFYIELPV